MLERILPAMVGVAEACEDRRVELFPAEEAIVARATPARRREFVTGRACARDAFAALGLPPEPVPSGAKGEPLWPAGIVGSITHCDGYRACAVARETELAALGIDAEPDLPLPRGLAARVARPEEREALRRLGREEPGICWDRLLFSIKESVHKAWFPLTGRSPGLADVAVSIDRERRSFMADPAAGEPREEGAARRGFAGRWLAAGGLLVTAVALPGAALSAYSNSS